MCDVVQNALAAGDGNPNRAASDPASACLGDVMIRDGDLFGDAVNISARLQSLAEPAASAFQAQLTIMPARRSR